MTAEELAYVGALAKAARGTVHALERELTLPHSRRARRVRAEPRRPPDSTYNAASSSLADDFAALAKKLTTLADGLSGPGQRARTQRLALAAKKDALAAAAQDVGADLAMSNWKRAKLGARFDVVSDTVAEIIPRPAGPWKVITEGAAAHTVTPKRRGGKRALRTPYGPRPSVRIPHTRGKGTWDKAAKKIAAETPERVNAEVVKLLKQVF